MRIAQDQRAPYKFGRHCFWSPLFLVATRIVHATVVPAGTFRPKLRQPPRAHRTPTSTTGRVKPPRVHVTPEDLERFGDEEQVRAAWDEGRLREEQPPHHR